MVTKRNRSGGGNPLPTDILSSLESSDQKAAKLRRSQISTETLPRSYAAKSQVEIQTVMMECRILLQRALATPIPHLFHDIDDGDSEVKTKKKIKSSLDEIMSNLVNARHKLCSAKLQSDTTDSESDSDSDSDSNDDKTTEGVNLGKEYAKLRSGWKSTLNKHHSNVHLQMQQNKNKFQVVDQSFWTQVENTAKHSMILETAAATDIDDEDNNSMGGIVFDDSKLYQHMLQEYVTMSTDRGKDNAASAAADRLKRSLKKTTKKSDVDRKASKGRKIRYVVHEKITNFTFPMQRAGTAIMDEDVLFKSMFGGVVNRH